MFDFFHPFHIMTAQCYDKNSVLQIIPIGDVYLIHCSIGLEPLRYVIIVEQLPRLIDPHCEVQSVKPLGSRIIPGVTETGGQNSYHSAFGRVTICGTVFKS